MPQHKQVTIHTDGGCSGNPGIGGWAAVLTSGNHRREISGGVAATTNNRMELQAAIEALAALKVPCEVTFFTDSNYVKNGVTEWIFGWKRNGWMTKAKQPVKNADLWRELDRHTQRHEITWQWLKGHAGHAENERCDVLANEAIAQIRKDFPPEHLRRALDVFRSSEGAPADANGTLL